MTAVAEPTTRTALRCHGCGALIERPRRGGRKWCSERCRKRTRYSGTCIDCGGRTDGSASGRRVAQALRGVRAGTRRGERDVDGGLSAATGTAGRTPASGGSSSTGCTSSPALGRTSTACSACSARGARSSPRPAVPTGCWPRRTGRTGRASAQPAHSGGRGHSKAFRTDELRRFVAIAERNRTAAS